MPLQAFPLIKDLFRGTEVGVGGDAIAWLLNLIFS